MRTMRWPPVLKNGRLDWVEGVDATSVVVATTVSDLRQNPFNPDGLSLGSVVFNTTSSAEAKINLVLARLRSMISIDKIEEVTTREDRALGTKTFLIRYIDRETRQYAETALSYG